MRTLQTVRSWNVEVIAKSYPLSKMSAALMLQTTARTAHNTDTGTLEPPTQPEILH
jgi:hypothetical protein